MSRGRTVTHEVVEAVKQVKVKHPDLPNAMVAKLCDTSEATVSRVLSGYYDGIQKESSECMDVSMLVEEQRKTNGMLTCVLLVLANMVDPTASHSKELANRARKLARENMETRTEVNDGD